VALPTLTEEEWEALSIRLTKYAEVKMLRIYWYGVPPKRGVAVPGGASAEDVVIEAITSVLQGRRQWPAGIEPMPFFRGVVDSIVSHMAECAEKQRRHTCPPGANGQMPDFDPPAEDDPEPSEILVREEEAAQFQELITKAAEKEPLALEMLDCALAEFTTPRQMAEVTGRPVEEFYRAKQRLRAFFETAQRKHRNQRPQS
jgi:DNA-directed RNA polymerase specialized sigma24 family protein